LFGDDGGPEEHETERIIIERRKRHIPPAPNGGVPEKGGDQHDFIEKYTSYNIRKKEKYPKEGKYKSEEATRLVADIDAADPVETSYLPNIAKKRMAYSSSIEALLENQRKSGYWELSEENISLMGLDCTVADIEDEVLIRTGCRSLGQTVFHDARAMVATSLVVAYLRRHVTNSAGPAQRGVEDAVERGRMWLEKMDKFCPMLPYRLDLGASWDSFATRFLSEKNCYKGTFAH